jgi:hypothetical protein
MEASGRAEIARVRGQKDALYRGIGGLASTLVRSLPSRALANPYADDRSPFPPVVNAGVVDPCPIEKSGKPIKGCPWFYTPTGCLLSTVTGVSH